MTYNNQISHWYGRLGNNIQQICNGIMFSKMNGDGFKSIQHDLINEIQIDWVDSNQSRSGKFFHYNTQNIDFNMSVDYIFKNIRSVALEYITPNLKVELSEPFGEDTLVIHIRSGDIFAHEHNPPHDYIPNPLCYYQTLIDEFEKVIVVTEPDNYNPVIDELKKNDKVVIQSKTVGEDFATLMRSKNIASSGIGTFAVAAALCSKNVKNFYCTNVYLDEHLNPEMLMDTDVIVHMMNLDNYFGPKSWVNNQEQRKFILEYTNESI